QRQEQPAGDEENEGCAGGDDRHEPPGPAGLARTVGAGRERRQARGNGRAGVGRRTAPGETPKGSGGGRRSAESAAWLGGAPRGRGAWGAADDRRKGVGGGAGGHPLGGILDEQ